MAYFLNNLTKKKEVDCIIRDKIDKVLVLRFGRASEAACLQLDDILSKSVRDASKFAAVALVDGLWAIYRGAMKGKLITNCPPLPERIPRYQLLYKDNTGVIYGVGFLVGPIFFGDGKVASALV